MQRIIEFRARRNYTNVGEWAYGYYFFHHDKHFILPHSADHKVEALLVDANTVGQWTALTDRHNQDLYEGDIILPFGGSRCVVKFEDGAFYYVSMNNADIMFHLTTFTSTHCVLVGNIHEENKNVETDQVQS